MRGLLEKDIRIMKNQKKMMLIFVGVGILLLFSGTGISFILPYMSALMTTVALSTISYDCMDNGKSFLFTLPVSRKSYALEKYLFATGFGIFCCIVVAIACQLLLLLKNSSVNLTVLGTETAACLLIVFILVDLMIPLQIKFGAEKAKIMIFATVGVMVLFFEVIKYLDESLHGVQNCLKGLWELVSTNTVITAIAAVLLITVLTILSWMLSCHVLEHQEM